MAICLMMTAGIGILFFLYKKGKVLKGLERKEIRYIFLILILSNLMAFVLFVLNWKQASGENEVVRNTYGEGSKKETFKVTLEGELESEPIMVEVKEREYTQEETKEMFAQVIDALDEVILGENESFDKIEHDLKLVSVLEEYPVEINWELSCYDVIDEKGAILEEYNTKEGTLVELRGTIMYLEMEAVYTANAMIFPEVKSAKEMLLDEIMEVIEYEEEETRQEESFVLPKSIHGKKIKWQKEKDTTGYYVIVLGIVAVCFILIKKKRDEQEKKKKRQEQMLRDYPEIVSKFTLLLSTGMTLKAVWLKIIQTYEEQKKHTGIREVYEEMCIAGREMQGGITEKEAYERFGQRIGLIPYMKFSALLSQNLKKGNKGLTEILSMESMQAFEERKSIAKKAGEEASTKLMFPMFGMLAVVLFMVIVPAFLSIQI